MNKICIQFTPYHLTIVQLAAEKLGLTVSEFCKLALNEKIDKLSKEKK